VIAISCATHSYDDVSVNPPLPKLLPYASFPLRAVKATHLDLRNGLKFFTRFSLFGRGDQTLLASASGVIIFPSQLKPRAISWKNQSSRRTIQKLAIIDVHTTFPTFSTLIAYITEEIPVDLVDRRRLEIQNCGWKTGSTSDLGRYMYLSLQAW